MTDRAAHHRRRRRHRRLRLRRRADRAGPAAAGPDGRAARARTSSALRDRRIVHAARQPPARGARRPLRPAARPRRSRSGAPGARTYPDVACGLKRGFTFFHHDLDVPVRGHAAHARQLLVAASPNDEIADTHWYRPDFDHWLVREAEREGARYVDELSCRSPLRGRACTARLEGERRDQAIDVRARFVIDASGPRGFLHRALGLPRRRRAGCRRRRGSTRTSTASSAGTRAASAGRHAAVSGRRCGGAPRLSRRLDLGAAFQQRHHQRGRGGDRPARRRLGAAEGAPAWTRLLDRLPSVARSSRRARRHAARPRAAGRRSASAGRGPDWALLPSAAGVIDPLLSTGFPLTLLGIVRLDSTRWRPPARAGARRVRAADAGRARCDRAAGRRALRDHDRLRRCSSG